MNLTNYIHPIVFSIPIRILILSLGLLALVPAEIQAKPTLVKSIEVRYVGSPSVSRERILAMMATKTGQLLSAYRIDEDIKTLCKSGEIINARILAEEVPDGLDLIVIVECRALYGGVEFRGNSILPDRRLSRTITLEANEPVLEAPLRKSRQEIKDLYRKKGYPNVSVHYDIHSPQSTPLSIVRFIIDEREPGILRKISFEGNQGLPAEEIKEAMSQKERSLENVIGGGGRTDAESVASDVLAIEDFYRDHGYFDAKVVRVAKIPVDSRHDDLVFTIREGQVYRVSEIIIDGADSLSSDIDLASYLKSQAGKAYNGPALREDIEMILKQYQARGYIDARVTPRLE